jgi:hypothetical protein
MLKADDRIHFEGAMKSEFSTMLSKEVFELWPRSKVPKGHKILQAIWSFRRKRTPAGIVYRYRARLCAHGGQQTEGIDFFETYAPVVSWNTVRLVFTLTTLKGSVSRQIDYVQAFPQAPLEDEVYMLLPKGCITADEGDASNDVLRLEEIFMACAKQP